MYQAVYRHELCEIARLAYGVDRGTLYRVMMFLLSRHVTLPLMQPSKLEHTQTQKVLTTFEG